MVEAVIRDPVTPVARRLDDEIAAFDIMENGAPGDQRQSMFQPLLEYESGRHDPGEQKLAEVRPAFEDRVKQAEKRLEKILSPTALQILMCASDEESIASPSLFTLLCGMSGLGTFDCLPIISSGLRTSPSSIYIKLCSFKGEDKSNVSRLFTVQNAAQLLDRGKAVMDDLYTQSIIEDYFNWHIKIYFFWIRFAIYQITFYCTSTIKINYGRYVRNLYTWERSKNYRIRIELAGIT